LAFELLCLPVESKMIDILADHNMKEQARPGQARHFPKVSEVKEALIDDDSL
jgi:hypothetical protein